MDISKEIEVISRVFGKDCELMHSWHDNLAMAFYDAMPEHIEDRHEIANEGAMRFMSIAFGVKDSRRETQKSPLREGLTVAGKGGE